jgi:hypothetical protein
MTAPRAALPLIGISDRAMVVIKVPDNAGAYADRDFKPTQP